MTKIKTVSKKQKDLTQRGFTFTGFYSRDKEEAKAYAAKLRSEGLFACVLSKIYKGRVYNTEGYSVYSKTKKS